MTPIYLDYAATSPLDPRVLDQMLPTFRGAFGNPASRGHRVGWRAAQAVDGARDRVARAIGAASPREIVFTSGATEANNLALKGVAHRRGGSGVVTSQTEHKSVLDTCGRLAARGHAVTHVAPGADGRVDPGAVADAITPDTALVSLMLVNNETGAIHPIAAIARVTRAAGVLLHCDATQAVGQIHVDVEALGVDLLSLSAHKLYGPMGVGALYVRRGVVLEAQLDGGDHEGGRRSGTLNLPGIVGLGAACALADKELPSCIPRIRSLRRRLLEYLTAAVPDLRVNGPTEAHAAPGILNLSVAGVESGAVLAALPNLALSAGSACTSASLAPSHVLTAMGVPAALARSSIRFSLGRPTTLGEVDRAAAQFVRAVTRLRRRRPAAPNHPAPVSLP